MKNLICLLAITCASLTAYTKTFTGDINSKIIGQQTLQIKLESAYGARTTAEASTSTDYDTRDLFCNSGLKFKNTGTIEYSINDKKTTENLSLAVGSRSELIDSEEQCQILTYSSQDLNNQWLYNGSHSSLILSVKKSGANTVTRKITFQFAMPMLMANGDLVRMHETNDYYLQNISHQLKASTYITFQIVDETRGEYTSWSTLEQGQIYLK